MAAPEERKGANCSAVRDSRAIRSSTPASRSARRFSRIYRAQETINADTIASFLLLPHATMPNPPLSRKDAQDIALFIIEMKK